MLYFMTHHHTTIRTPCIYHGTKGASETLYPGVRHPAFMRISHHSTHPQTPSPQPSLSDAASPAPSRLSRKAASRRHSGFRLSQQVSRPPSSRACG
eukprot:scaffold53688_cov57-Phaeocystis_antarctica.AAC.2